MQPNFVILSSLLDRIINVFYRSNNSPIRLPPSDWVHSMIRSVARKINNTVNADQRMTWSYFLMLFFLVCVSLNPTAIICDFIHSSPRTVMTLSITSVRVSGRGFSEHETAMNT